MRQAPARGSVSGLLPTESILFKRLSMRSKINFKLAETGIPKIVLDIPCAPAIDDVVVALGCAKRKCVFEGAAGQLYSLLPGPNVHMMPAVRNFSKTACFNGSSSKICCAIQRRT